jgi:hypothetical protein
MPKRGQRPNAWRSGPDPLDHAQYRTWIQARNQANFRGEGWTVTFTEFQELWREHWAHKGRGSNDYCMTRSDVEGAWELGNVEVIPRHEHFSRAGKRRNKIRWGN